MTPALETYLSCQAFKLFSHPEISEETVSCAPTLSSKAATMMPSSVDKPFSCFFCGTHLCRHQRHVKVRLGRRVIRSPSILSLGGMGIPGSPVLFLCIYVTDGTQACLFFPFLAWSMGLAAAPPSRFPSFPWFRLILHIPRDFLLKHLQGFLMEKSAHLTYSTFFLFFLPLFLFSLPLSHDFFFSHVCMYIFCAHIYVCSNVYGHVHLYLHTCVFMCVEHRLMLGVSLYDFSSYILWQNLSFQPRTEKFGLSR